jgi:putative membrane protein
MHGEKAMNGNGCDGRRVGLVCLLGAGVLAVAAAGAEPTRMPQDSQQEMQPQSGQGPERVASAAGVQYLSHQDRRFVTQALESGIAEMQELQLAERHAANPVVRRAADHLRSEQALANARLERIAANHGVVAPREATEDRRAQFSKLRSLAGANFDKEFLRSQIYAHTRALQLYQRAQLESTSRTVKTFVAAMLPKIRQDIAMLQSAQATGNTGAQTRTGSGSALIEPISPAVEGAEVSDAAVSDAGVDASVTPPQPEPR